MTTTGNWTNSQTVTRLTKQIKFLVCDLHFSCVRYMRLVMLVPLLVMLGSLYAATCGYNIHHNLSVEA